MSYESEERYWTDYLRVALPVIGLLLMLALFWWWAQQFIGDDGDPNDVAATTATAVATIAPPSPTATVEVTLEATEGSDAPTEESGNGGDDETPDEPTDCDSDFTESQQVAVTEDGVRLREEPDTTQDNIVETLEQGTTLVIIAECYEEDDEGTQFWRVRNELTANTGYVAAQFLETAPDEAEGEE